MKDRHILINTIIIEQIRSKDEKAFKKLFDFAESLISSCGLDKTYYQQAYNLITKEQNIDINSDLFYGVFLHVIDPLQLFVSTRQKPSYKDKMIPFLINRIGSSYFLVTQKLAEVVNRFKEDVDFQSWVIKYSKNIYIDLKNQDFLNRPIDY